MMFDLLISNTIEEDALTWTFLTFESEVWYIDSEYNRGICIDANILDLWKWCVIY